MKVKEDSPFAHSTDSLVIGIKHEIYASISKFFYFDLVITSGGHFLRSRTYINRSTKKCLYIILIFQYT